MTDPGSGPHQDRMASAQVWIWLVLGLAVFVVGSLFAVRMDHQPDTSRDYPPRPQVPDVASVLLPAPEVDDEYLPCDDCHELNDPRSNTTERELEEEHDEMDFSHGNLWCLDCHDVDDRSSLHLAGGKLVDFEDSWRLCTQCHAKKLPDWRVGVHGKQTGHWRGTKEYRTCVVCHDPHDPPFKPIAPKPAPKRPEEIIQRQVSAEGASEMKQRSGREDS